MHFKNIFRLETFTLKQQQTFRVQVENGAEWVNLACGGAFSVVDDASTTTATT